MTGGSPLVILFRPVVHTGLTKWSKPRMLRGSWSGFGGSRRDCVSRMFLRVRLEVTDPKAKIHLVTGESTEKVQQDPFVGRTLSKNYTLIRLLGEGGMGKVYLAMNEGLKRRVAIKVLEAGKGGLAVERFNAEAKTAAQIESPHVVSVTDHFSDDVGNHFIVMEFVDGPDMETILEQGVFMLERLMPLVRQIGRGLIAAHNLGIIHRDLKCENVIIIRMDDEGEFAKIADFGIAKIVNEAMNQKLERRKLTRDDTLFLGTPWYMAPEQALGKEIDQRTDVYAFGVLVYRALTGEYPIGEGKTTVTEVYSRLVHSEDNATPIAVYKPEYAHLWPVLKQALAKDRNARYPDAKSFVNALEDAAGVSRPSRVSGMHAAVSIGHAPTLDVTGARKAPKYDKEAITLDPAAAPPAPAVQQAQAPSLRSLAIGLGALLAVAVGVAYVIANRSPHPETVPATEAPATTVSDPDPETVPEPPRPVVRLPAGRHGTPRVTPQHDPPPVVRTELVAPPVVPRTSVVPLNGTAATPTMGLPAVCSDFLPRRRGAGRAECLQYHAVVCGNAAHRTPWCDVIEATLHLPRPR